MTDAEEAPEAPKVTWDQVDSGSFPVRAASAPPPAPPRRAALFPPILEHLGLAIVRGECLTPACPGRRSTGGPRLGKARSP